MLRKEVDESADARREMRALADEDGMDRLGITGIVRFQHRFQPTGFDIRPDMELRKPRDTDSCQGQLPRGFAVAHLHIAGCREGYRFPASRNGQPSKIRAKLNVTRLWVDNSARVLGVPRRFR